MPTHGQLLVSGLGLMGGSLAAAATAAGWRVLLHHRTPATAHAAAARGYGRAITDLHEAHDADLAVVCTPVPAIPAAVRAVAAATRAVITDVGSTKAGLCAALADLGPRFVGSHPMCGSHRQGLDAADPQLYRDATVVVVPGERSALVASLWTSLGARVVPLAADAHDRAAAAASHLPHILAAAAAAGLSADALPLAASGFRDTTRVAAGDPALWTGILLANAQEVAVGIADAEQRLQRLRAAITANDATAVEAWLVEGRAGRMRFEGR